MNRQNRYCGSLLGLATCDALGTTLEFKKPGTFTPIADMVGGDPSACAPASGPTTLPWPSAWPTAWSSARASIRPTRCSATFAGGGKAI